MPTVDINYLAVLVAAIASFVIGMLWYSQSLFGKAWMKLSGVSEKKIKEAHSKGMGKTLSTAFISTLVLSYVLAYFVDLVGATTWLQAVQLAFWAWLGFFATTLLGSVLWEGRPWKLYLINIGHYLVSLIVMSLILALWV